MAVTLKRIFGPSAVASGTSTIRTAAARETYHSIMFVNTNASTAVKISAIGIGGVAAANQVWPAPITIAPGQGYEIDKILSLENADTLQVTTDGTGVTVTGYGIT